MKKLNALNLPVTLAVCLFGLLFTACSGDESSPMSAPTEMCWDEVITFQEAMESAYGYADKFVETYHCTTSTCKDYTLTVHRCVDNVEFH